MEARMNDENPKALNPKPPNSGLTRFHPGRYAYHGTKNSFRVENSRAIAPVGIRKATVSRTPIVPLLVALISMSPYRNPYFNPLIV